MRSVSRSFTTGDASGRSLRRGDFSSGEKPGRPQSGATLGDAIVASLDERLVVIDGDGLIVMVNAAWTTSPLPLPMFEEARPGANYFALCRRAAEGRREFAAIAEGTRAVARGQVLRYQATVAPLLPGNHDSFVVTATPLRDHADGAVITHAKAVPAQTRELAHAELALTGLSARLVAAQEQERSRVGRELHDDLGQRTASLATRIEILLRTPRLSAARLRAGVVDAKCEV